MITIDNCNICDAKLGDGFNVKEMMLGTREEFAYKQCTGCGTIQIDAVPESIAIYYPDYYYSLIQKVDKLVRLPFIKLLFNGFRIRKKYRKNSHRIFFYLKPLMTNPSQKILDIGCGNGKLICEMFNCGFTHVEGVDKYIDTEYDYNYGVRVFKKDLAELKRNNYDLLMMHHVFEHMDAPYEELCKCNALLKRNGHLMIRIPVVGQAWELYKQDWIQLDAPRHFFIHTEASIKLLAEKAGFDIVRIVYDSNALQFWGSELYKRDIALVDEETKAYHEASDFFSKEELATYELMSEELNRLNRGDQAVFYLKKKNNLS